MSLRSVEAVYEFLHGQREEARKHDAAFDRGCESALSAALFMLARVDSCDIAKLHAVIARLAPLLLIVPYFLIGGVA